MRRWENPPEAMDVETDDFVMQDYTIYSFMSTSKTLLAPAWLLAMHEIVEREAQSAQASRKGADSSGDVAEPKGKGGKRKQLAVMEPARRTRHTAVNNPSPLVRKRRTPPSFRGMSCSLFVVAATSVRQEEHGLLHRGYVSGVYGGDAD